MTGSSPRQLSLRLSLDDDATFDNFYIAGLPCDAASGNLYLVNYLQRGLLDWTTRVQGPTGTLIKDFVWLWGKSGSGCSHLLQAVCHALDAQGCAVFYLSLTAWREMDPEILSGLEQFDVLCLDDIDAIAGQPGWEEALFHLYNRMAANQTPLLIAAHSSPQHLGVELPDLHSRLQSAIVFQLSPLSDTEKLAALQMRAARRGFVLSDDVAAYLVSRSERSTHALFAILQQLDRHSLETQRKVTIPLLKSLMGW